MNLSIYIFFVFNLRFEFFYFCKIGYSESVQMFLFCIYYIIILHKEKSLNYFKAKKLYLRAFWYSSILWKSLYIDIHVYIIRYLKLTLILPTSKEIGLYHQYRTRSACTGSKIVGWPTSSSNLDIPKMIMKSAKNGMWIIPFKKFGMVKVNIKIHV